MDIMVDASVWMRVFEDEGEACLIAAEALSQLIERGHRLYVSDWIVTELYRNCTLPVTSHGLGMTPAEADELREAVEIFCTSVDDPPGFATRWTRVAAHMNLGGHRAGDVCIAESMKVHGISTILTFNEKHFKVFDHVKVLEPEKLLATMQIKDFERTKQRELEREPERKPHEHVRERDR